MIKQSKQSNQRGCAAERGSTHTVEVTNDLAAELMNIKADRRRNGDKIRVPVIMAELIEKSLKVQKLVASREYGDKELGIKIRKIYEG